MLGEISPLAARSPNRKQLLVTSVTVITAVILGLAVSQFQSIDDSLPFSLLMVLSYIVTGASISYAIGRKFNSTAFLVTAFLVALVIRYLVTFVFYFNHDALVATGLKDDLKYYEAGLVVARIISEQGLSTLFDLTTLDSLISLDSWVFYYFDALHFLIYPSLLLPVITLATVNALSGLLLYIISHLLVLGERTARYACLLWLFSPAAIGWAAINHKESLVVLSVLACIWTLFAKGHVVLRVLILAVALSLLAGLRWYIGLTIGLIVIVKTVTDTVTQGSGALRSVIIALFSLLVLFNIAPLIPRFETQLQSPESAIVLFSDIQEQSWERTGTEKSFASAVQAHRISPILGRIVTLFAFFFTPPITRWLGWAQFRVFGTLLFIVLLVYSIWGAAHLWHKDKFKYWALIALAIIIPALLANVPTLIGSRHRLQVEPMFILLGVVGLTRVNSRLIHVISVIGIFSAILLASVVDVFF